MINGLTYISNFITEDEQSSLIKTIDDQTWLLDLKRRTQHYGYKYDYTKKQIDDSMYVGPIPSWLEPYSTKLVEQKLFKELPDQVIINEYIPGQGISRHIDCTTCFNATIASLSLNSTCAMEFEQYKTGKKGTMMLAPLSLLVLSDEARYDWMHSIPARKEDKYGDEIFVRSRRISLTFRKVITRGFQMVSKEDIEYLRGEPTPLKITIPVKIEK